MHTKNIGVLLFYIPADGADPLILGRANDPQLFIKAAEVAIQEAEDRIGDIKDPVLAMDQAEEAGRLRKLLSMLIPAKTH